MRKSPGGRRGERHIDLAQPPGPAGARAATDICHRPRDSACRAVRTGVPAALCAPTRTSSRSVRRNSRSITGIAAGSAASFCHSGSVRAAEHLRRADRQPEAQAGTTIFCVSRSSISPPASSTAISSSIGPGGTSNSTRPGGEPPCPALVQIRVGAAGNQRRRAPAVLDARPGLAASDSTRR